MKLTNEEIQILINVIESVSIQGTESMKTLLALSKKLKGELETQTIT